MKKILLLLLVNFYVADGNAQDTTLKEYIGKYIFPEGSYVPSAEITLKDSILTINSVQGASDLVKKAKDTFALSSYDGTAYFRRDSNGKIAGIKVEVSDILLEGTRDVGKA